MNAVNPGPTDTGWDVGDPAGHMPLTGQVIDSEGGFVRRRF